MSSSVLARDQAALPLATEQSAIESTEPFMAYRSLLMPIDQGPLCSPRTRFALRLARDFEAQLTGVASTGLIELPGITSGAAALAEFATLAWDELRNHAEHACTHFKKECHAAGFKNFEAWVS
jgi:hypothetical protein